jgi:hypothetical protein
MEKEIKILKCENMVIYLLINVIIKMKPKKSKP